LCLRFKKGIIPLLQEFDTPRRKVRYGEEKPHSVGLGERVIKKDKKNLHRIKKRRNIAK
jgi:hypothetical protein